MTDWRNSRSWSRMSAIVGLVGGPLLFTVAALVAPAFTVAPEAPDEYLDHVADSPDLHLLSAVLFFVGGLLLVPGLIGVSRLLRGRRVGFAQLAVWLTLLGVLILPGFYLLNVVHLEMVDAGADREQMAALAERIEEGTAGTIFMAVFAAGTVIGLLLLAVALTVRGVVPIWGPPALVLAVVLGFVPDVRWASTLEFVLLLIGTSAIAWRIWSLSDDQWSAWVPLSGRPADLQSSR